MRRFPVALLVGACAFGIAACGSGGSGKIGVSDNGKKITIGNSKNGGNITVGGAALPEGFPSSVPLPSDNKNDIVSGGAVTAAGETTWTVTYKVGKTGVKDYKAKLEDAGFTADSSYSGSSGSTAASYYALSNAKYKVNVVTGSDKNRSVIIITVTPNKDSSTTSTGSGPSTTSGIGRLHASVPTRPQRPQPTQT
jgi:hypothetical protein